MEIGHPTLTLTLALAAGVLAQSLARHLRLPGIVILLAAGVGLGPEGLGWVRPRDLGSGLYAIVDLAVAVILFEGGLNLQISQLRRQQGPIRGLITSGVIVTLAGASLASHWMLGWSWSLAVLFASLVVVTGPTVIGPLISELRLRPRVATVLEAEGVLIDPIGAILAVLLLEIVIAPGVDSIAAGGLGLLLRLGFGAIAGAIAGLGVAFLLRTRRIVPEGHENILTLASVLLLQQICDFAVPHSGILAVTIAGVAVGNLRTLVDRDLREFKDQLSVLLIGLLFIMLAADVGFDQVRALGLGGIGVVATLVFVIRPLGAFVSSLGSDLTWRDRLFIGWVAPRGIVAAAVASVVAGALEQEGIEGGLELRALVFLTIASTVVLAGLTAAPVGHLLGVRLPGREGIAILGANSLGLAMAEALQSDGRDVVFLDSNPQSCRAAQEAGFNVVYGNAIQERTMQRAHFHSIACVVSLTANKTLNGVFASRAREGFGVPRTLVAASQLDSGLVDEMVQREETEVVFDGLHDVQRWDVRWRRGDVEVVRRRYRAPSATGDDGAGEEQDAPPRPERLSLGERAAILTIHRAKTAFPMSMNLKPDKGDEATIAIHKPEAEDAFRILESMGWFEIPEMIEEPAETSQTAT